MSKAVKTPAGPRPLVNPRQSAAARGPVLCQPCSGPYYTIPHTSHPHPRPGVALHLIPSRSRAVPVTPPPGLYVRLYYVSGYMYRTRRHAASQARTPHPARHPPCAESRDARPVLCTSRFENPGVGVYGEVVWSFDSFGRGGVDTGGPATGLKSSTRGLPSRDGPPHLEPPCSLEPNDGRGRARRAAPASKANRAALGVPSHARILRHKCASQLLGLRSAFAL